MSLTLVCDFCFNGGIVGGLNRIFKDPPHAKIEFEYTDNGRPNSVTSSFVKKMEVKKEAPLKPVIFIHTAHKYEPTYGGSEYTFSGLEHIAVGTHFLIDAVEKYGENVVHMNLVEYTRDMCMRRSCVGKYVQHPRLSCSDDECYKYFLGGNCDATK